MQVTEASDSAGAQHSYHSPFSRWRERRESKRLAMQKEKQAIWLRSDYDLRGLDYSDYHGPRSMEAYHRERRMQRRVTWLVMSAVVLAWVLGFAL